jgi:hypothetical protein
MRWLLNPLVHGFYDALRLVGMRDRMRCPKCRAVGTWKPHGGLFDVHDKRRVRRWMCKWCGFYVGPEAIDRVHIGEGVWELGAGRTPQSHCGTVFPWRG